MYTCTSKYRCIIRNGCASCLHYWAQSFYWEEVFLMSYTLLYIGVWFVKMVRATSATQSVCLQAHFVARAPWRAKTAPSAFCEQRPMAPLSLRTSTLAQDVFEDEMNSFGGMASFSSPPPSPSLHRGTDSVQHFPQNESPSPPTAHASHCLTCTGGAGLLRVDAVHYRLRRPAVALVADLCDGVPGALLAHEMGNSTSSVLARRERCRWGAVGRTGGRLWCWICLAIYLAERNLSLDP